MQHVNFCLLFFSMVQLIGSICPWLQSALGGQIGTPRQVSAESTVVVVLGTGLEMLGRGFFIHIQDGPPRELLNF